MKYVKEIAVIWAVTMIGEWLNMCLPFPVPTGVYGLFVMLILLCTGIIRLQDVEHVGGFLLDIMPLLFIPASVAVMESFGDIKPVLGQLVAITLLTTIIVMTVTGRVSQWIIKRKERKEEVR